MIHRRLVTAACALAVTFAAATGQAAWDPEEEKKTQETIQKFKDKDPGMEKFFDGAHGYVVFPSIGKGGFIVSGARGRGTLFEKGVPIGKARISQVAVGLTAGGQAFSQVIFFENEAALERFKSSRYEVAAGVSAVIANAGAAAKAAYNDGVAIFAMTLGGAMAEASIGGQKFKFEPAED